MTRGQFCEGVLRRIYGGQLSDDTEITPNQVNLLLQEAIGMAAKQNYTDAIKLDGISYINNSFYATYKGLPIIKDDSDNFLYALTLPQIPVGIGKNEGVATLQFKKNGETSLTAIPLSANQVGYRNGIRPIGNKILYWVEGNQAKVETTLQLYTYTATVRMVSGGDSTDLSSVVNVPDDYFPSMEDYVYKLLMPETMVQTDQNNDGSSTK